MAQEETPTPQPPTPGESGARPASRWRRLVRLAAADVGPLRRNRDFRLLWIGQGVSLVGASIIEVAVPFQVYQLTHSTLLVGLISGAELVPMLVLGLAGGLLADAKDRRTMVIGSEIAFAVVSLTLLLNSLQRHPSVAVIFILAAMSAALFAIQRPSLDSLLPRLVSPAEIPAASALNSIRGTAGMILGPALAGVLIAAAGLPYTYAIDVLAVAVSLVALWLMKAVPPPSDADGPSLRRLAEGLRYAWSRQELVGTYLVDIAAMFFGMPLALFPAIAERLGGASVLGLLYAAPAVGALLLSLSSGWNSGVHRHGLALVWAATGWGLAIIAFGFATSVPLALVFLALSGAADMASGLFRSAIWNQTIP
ncbi:MAG TPA: MFS transporter, partial [Candidatus Dormibacteraeota bacterium]|nr:MFS transporter [Candidatus Dormibacteraeota bacterium]